MFAFATVTIHTGKQAVRHSRCWCQCRWFRSGNAHTLLHFCYTTHFSVMTLRSSSIDIKCLSYTILRFALFSFCSNFFLLLLFSSWSQELSPKHVQHHPNMQMRIILSLNSVLLLLCYYMLFGITFLLSMPVLVHCHLPEYLANPLCVCMFNVWHHGHTIKATTYEMYLESESELNGERERESESYILAS